MSAKPSLSRMLTPADADAGAQVLARAFLYDPLWCALQPDLRRRIPLIRQAFRAAFPWFVRKYDVSGVGEPLAGVAVWEAPRPRQAAWRALFNRHSPTLLFSPFLLAFQRAFPIFSQFERMRRQYATRPHYYLSILGVIPEARGRGAASQLLRPTLRRVDAEGLDAYTETMTPANVPLYQHFGFECREEYRVPATDLRIWALHRPARR